MVNTIGIVDCFDSSSAAHRITTVGNVNCYFCYFFGYYLYLCCCILLAFGNCSNGNFDGVGGHRLGTDHHHDLRSCRHFVSFLSNIVDKFFPKLCHDYFDYRCHYYLQIIMPIHHFQTGYHNRHHHHLGRTCDWPSLQECKYCYHHTILQVHHILPG